jgi:hypothetical protein
MQSKTRGYPATFVNIRRSRLLNAGAATSIRGAEKAKSIHLVIRQHLFLKHRQVEYCRQWSYSFELCRCRTQALP